jgi:hypothetical protein
VGGLEVGAASVRSEPTHGAKVRRAPTRETGRPQPFLAAEAHPLGSNRDAGIYAMAGREKTLIHEEIARKAYETWVAEGRPAGRALTHWIMAKKQLLAPAGVASRAGAREAAPAPLLVAGGARPPRSAAADQAERTGLNGQRGIRR